MEQSTRIDELERKFGENPRRYFAALANEYRKNGELDQAIELCRRHLTEQGSHLSGHVVLGQALAEAGKSAEAWSVLRRALDLDPENFIALRVLGELSAQSGERAEARDYFVRALEIEPRSEQLLAAVAALQPAVVQPEPEAVAEPQPPGVTDWAEAGAAEGFEPTQLAEPYATAEGVPEPVDSAASEPIESTEPERIPLASAPPQPIPIDTAPPEPETEAEPEMPRAVLVSETMADLYLEQGHRVPAMDVLRELLSQRPADERLAARLAALEQEELESRATVRDLFARLGARAKPATTRADGGPAAAGLAALFGDSQESARDMRGDALLAAVAPVQSSSPGEEELNDWLARLRQP
jgi:tetratricopeptide (TPR) repeat protein